MPTVTDAIRKEVFPNHLVLVTERMPNIRSVALGVWMIVLYRRYGTWARRRVPA